MDHATEKWLIAKGNLDFGPFTMTQVKEQIASGEVVSGHLLIDSDSGQRTPVEAHPLLHDLVLDAAERQAHSRRLHADLAVERQEKRRRFVLLGVGAAGLLALAAAAFLALGGSRAANQTARSGDVARLDSADVTALKVGALTRIDDRARRSPRPRSAAGSAGGPGAAALAGDDTLAVDMNDDSVGDERLDDGQINSVIVTSGRSLSSCIIESARAGGTRSAEIEFTILGSGKVAGVRVNGEAGSPLAGCVRGRMQSWRFPAFDGPRTRASFPISM